MNCKFEIFKSAVDKFLSGIPDEPHLTGYHLRTGGSSSNCLLDYVWTPVAPLAKYISVKAQ